MLSKTTGIYQTDMIENSCNRPKEKPKITVYINVALSVDYVNSHSMVLALKNRLMSKARF